MNNPLRELSKNEWGLWSVSLCIVTVSNFAAGNPDFLTLAATWIGITSLIFAAKGNVWAQLLMIVFSTISVMTSFLAAALTMLRSSYYALGYAANDMVLIILWSLAAAQDTVYLPVVINFFIFFLNDMYGFISWKKREHKKGGQIYVRKFWLLQSHQIIFW